MDTTERKQKAKELLDLAAMPGNTSAGQLAQAAADLLAQCDRQVEQARLHEKMPEFIAIAHQMIESMNRKPAEAPALTKDQLFGAAVESVNQAIARSVASSLIQGAVDLERTAAMGVSGHHGGLTVGSGLAPMLGEDECAKLRERAGQYRAKAVTILANAGLTEASQYPFVAGCP
jgi:hypothetical protein